MTWTDCENQVYEVRYYGNHGDGGGEKDRKVFVLAGDAEEAIEAVKQFHDPSAIIMRVRGYWVLEPELEKIRDLPDSQSAQKGA